MAVRMMTGTGVEVTVPDEAVEHYVQSGFLLDADEAAEDSPARTTRKRK